MASAFFAYPSEPSVLGEQINKAIEGVSEKLEITPWPKVQIEGLKLDDLIRDQIDKADWLLADITVPNFNVYYEIGYALAKGKVVIPTANTSVESALKNVALTGIFDTLGQLRYDDPEALSCKLLEVEPGTFLKGLS